MREMNKITGLDSSNIKKNQFLDNLDYLTIDYVSGKCVRLIKFPEGDNCIVVVQESVCS